MSETTTRSRRPSARRASPKARSTVRREGNPTASNLTRQTKLTTRSPMWRRSWQKRILLLSQQKRRIGNKKDRWALRQSKNGVHSKNLALTMQ